MEISPKVSVAICSTSRFHYQQLAFQLLKSDLLCSWVTALPLTKIPVELRQYSVSRPLSLAVYLASQKLARRIPCDFLSLLVYCSNKIFDAQALTVVKHLDPMVVIGLSHNISQTGYYASQHGASYFCDVPIAHPSWLNSILSQEYSRLGLSYSRIHERQIEMESVAHQSSSKIVCPSSFVKETLESQGVNTDKITVIPYGSERVYTPKFLTEEQTYHRSYTDHFRILFVGQLSPRKGIHYLLEAFTRLRHPSKSLTLAGAINSDSKKILNRYNLDNVFVLGLQTKAQLHFHYSQASVFVIPSIAEGLALVVGEAMSYGLPIIYTYETGASEIVSSGVEGLMIQGGQFQSILDALELLADNVEMRFEMGRASLKRSLALSGWDVYGDNWKSLISAVYP